MNSEPPADRRSVTMPIRLSESSAGRRGSSASIPGKQDETLFEHPSVRIVAFSTASPATRRASSSQNTGADQEEEEGTLPWSSSMERTIAVGMIENFPSLLSVKLATQTLMSLLQAHFGYTEHQVRSHS